jgi:cysteinyl-tRNA synthetase
MLGEGENSMPVDIIALASAVIPAVVSPVIEFFWSHIGQKKQNTLTIQNAVQKYKSELQANWSLLDKIKLDEINTKEINNPAVTALAKRLNTEAGIALLSAIVETASNPKKSLKALAGKKPSKTEIAEAAKLIKTIIAAIDKINALQQFTTLTEAERTLLRGFYVRARINHIKEKTLYIKKSL